MRKTYVYIISLMTFLSSGHLMAQTPQKTEPPDTVTIPLNFRAGIDVAGTVIYLTDKNKLTAEGYISADLNEKRSVFLAGGYSNYKHSQHNYSYITKGFFIKAGIDFNLLKPETAIGKYWAGIGLRYGLSSFIDEIPSLSQENYWGTTSLSIASQSHWGHFIEASPGFRADLFGNLAIGWSISLRKLIYAGSDKDMRPIYFPGYGSGGKSFSTGFNYYIVWNIPYKKIRVVVKKEIPEEPEETDKTGGTQNTMNNNR